MQVINEKLVGRKKYAQSLRALKPNTEVLVVDIAERNSVSAIVARLKKAEGMEFITQKDGDKLKVQRIISEEPVLAN